MTIRQVTPKRWTALIAVGAAAGFAQAAPLAAATSFGLQATPGWITLASGEAGESGESGESGAAIESSQTVQLLTGLALIEGHLRAGSTLYQEGAAEMAKTHMKHPQAEIYTDLEPLLQAAGADGFAAELEALASAVESGADAATAQAAFEAVLASIAHAREDSGAGPRAQFDAMMAVMRVAAEEYAIGVKGGEITNMHEYQDAWGFTQATRVTAERLRTNDDAEIAEAAQKVLEALTEAEQVFEGVQPDVPLTGDSSALLGAAARIELAGLRIK